MSLAQPVMRNPLLVVGLVLVLLSSLVACGKKNDAKSEAPATQSVARVDGAEISVHQINFALSRLQNAEASQADRAGKEILERLIDQQLLVTKAVDAKLDREPRVMQTIEESRRQILAQAYLEKTMAAVSSTPADEVAKFYKERPELFAQRRQFRYAELSAAPSVEVAAELKKKLESGANINDAAAFLKSKSVEVNAANFERTSEQLPLDLLPRLHQVKAGQTALIQGRDRISLIQMIEVKDLPLNEAQAKPLIERYLVNQKRMQLAQNEVKQLRESAKVEYLGAFKAPAAKASEAGGNSSQVSTPGSAEASKSNFIDKGLSGMR